jgi:hypothetical protein
MRRNSLDSTTMLSRMMECSELRISEVAKFEEGYRKQVASRVLESTHTYRHWEASHSQLMRGIVGASRTERQVEAVKRMALSMIHSKAPFEYLRDRNVCGSARHRFFRVLYGPHDFANAMVREHRTYLSSACSYICVDQFCAPTTMSHITEYEKVYTSYWQAQTSFLLDTSHSSEREQKAALLQCIREDLHTVRSRVLAVGPSRADALTLEELRRPTGDTVKLRSLNPAAMPRAYWTSDPPDPRI